MHNFEAFWQVDSVLLDPTLSPDQQVLGASEVLGVLLIGPGIVLLDLMEVLFLGIGDEHVDLLLLVLDAGSEVLDYFILLSEGLGELCYPEHDVLGRGWEMVFERTGILRHGN